MGGRLALCQELERNLQHPLDPWNDSGLPSGVSHSSSTSTVGYPKKICLDATQLQALTEEVEELVRKEIVVAVPLEQGGFTSQTFLITKSDISWFPVINLKFSQQLHNCMALQNGISQNSQRPNSEWRLACQARPENAYFSVPIHLSLQPKGFLHATYSARSVNENDSLVNESLTATSMQFIRLKCQWKQLTVAIVLDGDAQI